MCQVNCAFCGVQVVEDIILRNGESFCTTDCASDFFSKMTPDLPVLNDIYEDILMDDEPIEECIIIDEDCTIPW
jgi:hypothetical protein